MVWLVVEATNIHFVLVLKSLPLTIALLFWFCHYRLCVDCDILLHVLIYLYGLMFYDFYVLDILPCKELSCSLPSCLSVTIGHLCGKIECIQEHVPRFMFDDHCSTYPTLLEKCNYTTVHVRRIKTIACKVFNSINKLNTVFMHDIFKTKDLSYQLRDIHTVYQPKFKGITYGICIL